MADMKALAKKPAESLDNLGEQLQFYVKAVAWTPRTIRRYKKEIARLLAEVTLGSGSLAVIGGTVGVITMMAFFTGTEVGLQGYAALNQIGTAMTSSASISSLIRMAPSWAVKPQPTVAARAMPATSGAISRVLKYADTKPEKAEVPSWLSAAYPWRPTSVPVKKHMAVMTPTVPPMTASAPEPRVTSARIRRISFL